MRQKFNETTQNIKSASKNLHDITTKIALIFSYVWSHNFCIYVQYCQSLSDRQINFTDGVRFDPSESCRLPSDNVLRMATCLAMQEVGNTIYTAYLRPPAGFRLCLILPCALSASHSPIDRSDPSDKVVYGRTIFLPMATHFAVMQNWHRT